MSDSMPRQSWTLFPCILVIILGIGMPGLVHSSTIVTRPGGSAEECSRVCIEEQDIDCRYYKFNKEKGMCTLATENDATITGLKKADKPDPLPIQKPASSWVDQLQTRIITLEQKNIDTKNLHKDITDLRAEIAALKNSRALTHHLLRTTKEQMEQNIAAVDEKTEVIKSQSKRVEDAVMTLGELQKTFGTKVRKLTETEKSADLTVTMLSQSSKDMRASVKEMANTITELRSNMFAIRKSVTDLQVRFAGLSTDVMEKVASVDTMIGPDLKELRNSQTTLAEALSLLTKKIMALTPRIPALQRKLSQRQGLLTVMDRKIKGYGRQINFINERLGFSEQQLRKVIDPSSRMNTERRQIVTQLRAQVASLLDSQTRLQNDILVEISDKTRLYKELSALKIGRKALVDKLMNLETAVQHFRSTLRQLASTGPTNSLISNILNRQVAALRSLKRLRDTQTEVQNALQDYKRRLLQTNRLLLTKDHRRMINELALRKLQAKLINVYRKLRWSMAHSAETRQVAELIQHHKQALVRMARMQQLQMQLQRDLGSYRSGIVYAKRMLANQQKQHAKEMQEMDGLRRKTLQMYYEMSTKMSHMSTVDTRKTLDRLAVLSKTQIAVLNMLETYRLNSMRTKQAIEYQRAKQIDEAKNSLALRLELRKLHQALALLIQEKLPPYPPQDRVTDEYQNKVHLQLEKEHLNTLKRMARVHRKMSKYDDLMTTLKTDPYWRPYKKKQWGDITRLAYLNENLKSFQDKRDYLRHQLMFNSIDDLNGMPYVHPRLLNNMLAEAANNYYWDAHGAATEDRIEGLPYPSHKDLYGPVKYPWTGLTNSWKWKPYHLYAPQVSHYPTLHPDELQAVPMYDRMFDYPRLSARGMKELYGASRSPWPWPSKKGKGRRFYPSYVTRSLPYYQWLNPEEVDKLTVSSLHDRLLEQYNSVLNKEEGIPTKWEPDQMFQASPSDIVHWQRQERDRTMGQMNELHNRILDHHKKMLSIKTPWLYPEDNSPVRPEDSLTSANLKTFERDQTAHVVKVAGDLRNKAMEHQDRLDELTRLPAWKSLQNTDQETAAQIHDTMQKLMEHHKKLKEIQSAHRDLSDLSELQNTMETFQDHQSRLDDLENRLQGLQDTETR